MMAALKALLAAGVMILTASAAAADGPPNLTGIWMPTVIAPDGSRNRPWPENPPFRPEVQAAYEAYKKNLAADPEDYDEARNCLPYGMPYQMLLVAQYPMEIVDTGNRLTMIFELHNDVRRIYLDERQRPTGLRPGFQGYSIGHWVGDTLSIETTHIREGGMPRPHGPMLKVIERIRLISDHEGTPMLEDVMTIHDPQTYTEPFTTRTYFRQQPGLDMGEYFCSEDLWRLNLSGKDSTIPWR
jgi:hypothetical protein